MTTTKRIHINGMHCASCVDRVERSLSATPGVTNASVNLVLNRATVDVDETVSDLILERAVSTAGYVTAAIDVVDDDHPGHEHKEHSSHGLEHTHKASHEWLKALYYAVPFTVLVMAVSMSVMFTDHTTLWPASTINIILLVLTLPVVYAGRLFYSAAFRAARHGSATMDTLVSLGAGAAFFYSLAVTFAPSLLPPDAVHVGAYYDTTCTIITLILVGKYLESNATSRTAEALQQLLELQPDTAAVVRNGTETMIPASSVVVGDVVRVKPGERIPVDGVVLEGSSSVNEAMITGEPLPRDVSKGAFVTGGTVNTTGSLTLEATAVGSRSVLSGIIRAVERAQESKAPVQRLADRISSVFVPVVLCIAAVTFTVWMFVGTEALGFVYAMNAAIAVLVIACPCALGLATPTAIIVGSGAAARRGILFANAASIETLHACDTVILDKTGTITEGRPRVMRTTFDLPAGMDEEFVWKLIASVESRSEHPVAAAIVSHATQFVSNVPTAADAAATPGMGMVGTVDGNRVRIGSDAMMTQSLLIIPPALEPEHGTAVYAAINGRVVVCIELADGIRSNSRDAIAELRNRGRTVVMLTGDRGAAARAIAQEADINDVIAEVKPEQKAAIVKDRQGAGARVAMVGDGINDAPALAQADVGIALGSGTDIAKTTADVTLMRSDLSALIQAMDASASTMSVIRQNLFMAFMYNVLAIPLAAGLLFPVTGWLLSPMIAAGAMALSSVTVVLNALRLKRTI